MFRKLGNFVTRFWIVVILLWCGVLIAVRLFAPSWDSITRDGDFEYLPSDSPSVVGQRVLDRAFPQTRSKSQLVLGVSRIGGEPAPYDLYVAYDLARRMHILAGITAIEECRSLQSQYPDLLEETPSDSNDEDLAIRADYSKWRERAQTNLDRAVELTQELFSFIDDRTTEGDTRPPIDDVDLAAAFHNRSIFHSLIGETDLADRDQRIASRLDPESTLPSAQCVPEVTWNHLITDVWTWQTDILGSKLIHIIEPHAYARLIILHLSSEFLAVENVELFEAVQIEAKKTEDWLTQFDDEYLDIAVSGSAAVGSDLLLASIESIRYTEFFTVFLVAIILLLVYRSPFLVVLPLITIGVSLLVSMSVLAALTQFDEWTGANWFDFNVYKTSRIFIVVILFGAGTDYCLFLVARYREEISRSETHERALPKAMDRVGNALAASALTTIVGLAMMFFAEFGKLRNSGPAIAIALAITLLACLTLAPALLRLLGRWAFWPSRISQAAQGSANDRTAAQSESAQQAGPQKRSMAFWDWIARIVTWRPGLILVLCLAWMVPVGVYGFSRSGHVTYDLLHSLDPNRPSRVGMERLQRHFPIGESGPIEILIEHPSRSFATGEDEEQYPDIQQLHSLARELLTIEGVVSVRSLAAPLGESRGGTSGVTNTSLRSIKQIRDWYRTPVVALEHRVLRLEVVLAHEPFSIDATSSIDLILKQLGQFRESSTGKWHEATYSVAGTSPAIRDLRRVTQRDTVRIELLVVVAVFFVLVVVLRRPIVCFYMIATVLLSFFVTIAITDSFFAWSFGEHYQGLEWRVPLFLFVILVAVGEDYNVYLASRVFEEQAVRGRLEGVRYAVARTGGIISSCGIIMAGTFGSMTSGTWGAILGADFPLLGELLRNEDGTLQGIVQMGFALTVGVLLDTFLVRPILLPAFLALVARWRNR